MASWIKICLMFIVSCFVLIAAALAFAENTTPKKATEATKKHNARLLELLPFANKQDMEDATRGLIAPLPNKGVIKNDKGEPVWDMSKFQFILDQEKAPDTVNPSLWRQSRLVMQGGLFKVVDGLYQVGNADLTNLTIIEGKNGHHYRRPAGFRRNRQGGPRALLPAPAPETGGGGRPLSQPC